MRTNKDGQHYRKPGAIEAIDYIISWDMGFLQGNIIKYATRYSYKGTPLEDLEKIEFYVKELKKQVLANNAPSKDKP